MNEFNWLLLIAPILAVISVLLAISALRDNREQWKKLDEEVRGLLDNKSYDADDQGNSRDD